jgi:hypothetical protein
MTGYIDNNWNLYLDQFSSSQKDIYFKEEYVKLYEDEANKAMCFIYTENSNILLFPFLRREFTLEGTTYCDFETPYGYGGPITKENDEVFLKKGLKDFFDICLRSNYVAGFLRFHPFLNNSQYYDTIGVVIEDRKTVAIDLTLSLENIWMSEICTKNRNLIRKAEKNGLIFLVDSEYKYMDEFINLYNATMSKLGADDFYHFDKTYFNKIKQIEQSFLGIVLYEDKVISSAIFFYSGEYGHYHLSGSDINYISLLPNNFLLYYAALELRRRGVHTFHLGGGTTSRDDDMLLQFKGRFSKKRYQFLIGKTIFNDNVYTTLVNEWIERNSNNKEKLDKYHHHLLKYRY